MISRGRAQRAFPATQSPISYPLADGLIILLSSLAGGVGYHLLVGRKSDSQHSAVLRGRPAREPHLHLANGRERLLRFSGQCQTSGRAQRNTGLLVYDRAISRPLRVPAQGRRDYSRGSFVTFCFLAPVGLLGVRKITKIALAEAVSRGAIGRRDTVLVGEFNEIAALEPQDLLAFFGAAEIDRFTLSRDADPSARSSTDRRIINSVADFVRRHNCREILLALPWGDTDRIEFVREQIKTLPVAARLLPDMRVRSLTNFRSSARQRVLAIDIQRAPLSGAQRFVKRIMDISLAALALIFFLPIMTLTAIAIKLDSPGPVIFRQNRKGFNGKQFAIFKFRTMTVQENGPAVLQATRDDPRVTAIGRLLRSASIDELPQLLNVLKGDMSLIGPRPHALAHDSYFENILSDYAFRHHVKPGITGWAQCNGARGATPSIDHISERVKLDLWYINNWSLWLDIQILIKTFFEVLRKRNAY